MKTESLRTTDDACSRNAQQKDQNKMDEEVASTPDKDALDWITQKANIEVSRLRELGIKPLLMQPLNCGIVRQDDHDPPLIINRIEIATNFDFASRVKQIMVSDPMQYPLKEDFLYANIILATENLAFPILVPYIYRGTLDKRRKDLEHNNLKEWLIINSAGSRARLSTREFHQL